ncbi:YdcF family protein [Novacetimonas pomaceti]|uniref:YdcF family protein n=1 Tax=Novacetimonas pomaceti TaxID=2021998 RepID=A0ABX5P4P0_9PROT|nr:YdcF family protein [Novacetimonas pomaceti]PYD48743.1 YdcF family protein [Novacetimonas pomaceti]
MARRPRLPIVIFGARVRPDATPSRTLRHRVEAAAVFARECENPFLIPTGCARDGLPSEARVMADLLVAGGVAPDDIVMEETARDTLDSVRACSQILHDRGHVGPVAIATSAYHLPRCMMLMSLAGWKVIPVPPPPHPAARSLPRRWFWRLREVAALPWDALLMVVRRGHRPASRD